MTKQQKIEQLEEDLLFAQNKLDLVLNITINFQSEILTPKYQGEDLNGDRKDWMAISDIDYRLNSIKSALILG